jgi:hypothetical protein
MAMKWKSLAFTALLLGAGPALAQYATLPSIQVRPDVGGGAMDFSCGYRVTPSPTDVEALLQIHDRTQTQALTNKLMDAVAAACASGAPSIVVSRGKAGRSLTWYPVGAYRTTVAAPVYYEPAPVYYEPAPAYYDTAPAYVEPAPVYVEPAPRY